MLSFRKVMKFFTRQHLIKFVILKQVKKRNLIIYGARAQNKRSIGPLQRPTLDYDIYSPKPKKSAYRLEKNLDKTFGGDYFIVKPAEHPGTWKVKTNPQYGDREVADFSKPNRKVQSSKIRGIKYTRLSMSEEDKKKSLSDPQYKFRHTKDNADLQRLLAQKRFQNAIRKKKRRLLKHG